MRTEAVYEVVKEVHTANLQTLQLPRMDVLPVVAKYAGFFDLATLTVCSKYLSRECATVRGDVLVVLYQHKKKIETYAGDGCQWRRCVDWRDTKQHAQLASTPGKLWRVGEVYDKIAGVGGRRLSRVTRYAAIEEFDVKRNMWRAAGWVRELEGCESYGCCALDGSLVFVGGERARQAGDLADTVPERHVIQFNPETGASAYLAPLPVPRSDPTCGVCDGKLVVLGGIIGSLNQNETDIDERASVLIYETRKGQVDTWSTVATLPAALRHFSEEPDPFGVDNVVFRGHQVFVVGALDYGDGEAPEVVDWTVRILDVRTRVWSSLETTITEPPRRIPSTEFTMETLQKIERAGGPDTEYGYEHFAIGFRDDIAVFDQGMGDDDDPEHPAIYVLRGDHWTATGGRNGFDGTEAPAWLLSCPKALPEMRGSGEPLHTPQMSCVDAACVVETHQPRATSAR